jgi:hypothetical protein
MGWYFIRKAFGLLFTKFKQIQGRKIVWAEAEIWGTGGEISASGVPNYFSLAAEARY